ncbi:MAG TPA: tetratricopeptide repeat protein [Ktedonobacteraceae bacterium]
MRNSESMPPVASRGSRDQLWMVPYARNPFFAGREEELQALEALLHDDQNTGSGLALYGAGGIGKTQLVLEYVYLHREEYGFVFWALAETRETLNAAYNDIAELLALPEKGLQEQRLIIEAVTRWLVASPAWLLILDGVGDPSPLKDFLPATFSGHILFTTRANGLGKLARRVRVKTLSADQASRLLLRRSGILRGTGEAALKGLSPKDEESARTLAAQVECLPLALNLAGAYLAETGCGLPAYLGRLRGARVPRVSTGDVSDEKLSGVLQKVVRLTGEKVAKSGSLAAQIVSLCAFLAPDEIPENLLVTCFAVLQKQTRKLAISASKREAALNTLNAYALLERDCGIQFLSMTREIQAAWRALLPASEEKSWAEQAVRAIGSIFAALDIHDWEACQRLLPHAQVCAAHIERWKLQLVEGAWLLHHMGWYLHTRGQYAEAQRYEERALAIYRTVLGNEHPSTAMILNNLAVTYEDQGKLQDAATLHAQALAIRRSVLGEKHLETAASLNNLALVYHDQGKLDDAAPLYLQALSIRRELLGEMHPEVATLLADLAALSVDQGKFHEALAHYQQALVIRRKVLGSRHAETIALLGGLSATYQAQGKFDEAIHWRQQALVVQRKTLGNEHPEVAATFRALATIYQAQGKLDEAAFWLQHSLALVNTPSGPVQPAPARALEALAIAYEEEEQHEKAEALYQQALAIYRRDSDGSSPDVARCSYNLALLYHDCKRAAEARPLLEQALAIWQEQRGPNHADTRKAREKYEQIVQKQKETRAKRGLPISESERHDSGGLKGIAQAFRRNGHKKA